MQVFVLRKTRRTEHSPEHDARDKEFFDHFYSKQNAATSLRQSDNDYNPCYYYNKKIRCLNVFLFAEGVSSWSFYEIVQ